MNKEIYNKAYDLYYNEYCDTDIIMSSNYITFINNREFNYYYNLAKQQLRKEKLNKILHKNE